MFGWGWGTGDCSTNRERWGGKFRKSVSNSRLPSRERFLKSQRRLAKEYFSLFPGETFKAGLHPTVRPGKPEVRLEVHRVAKFGFSLLPQ